MARPIVMARPVVLSDAVAVQAPNPMLLLGSSRGSAWFDLAVLLAVLILFEVMVGSLIGERAPVAAPEVMPSDAPTARPIEREWLLPLLCARALVATLTILGIIALRGQATASIGLRRENLVIDGLLGFATAAFAAGLVLVIMLSLALVWRGMREDMEENAKRIMELLPHLSVGGFVLLAVVIGAYEELVFRGFLMTRLRRGMGNWPLAIIVSSALFTLLHAADQEPAAMIAITVLALLFSVVTIWRRSIIPAIVAHTVWDLFQLLLLSFMEGKAWS